MGFLENTQENKIMKTILLITSKQSGEVFPFATLTAFFESYPKYLNEYSAITTALSRKKIPFEDEQFKIERKKIIR